MNLHRWLISFVVAACIWASQVHAEDRLWLECAINGQPVRLLFDTGASHSLLFKGAAARLGMQAPELRNDSTRDGRSLARPYDECALTFLGSTAKAQFYAIEIPDYIKSGADGVLGWGDIRENILFIDAGTQTLKPLERVPEAAAHWTKFKIQPESRILILETVEGKNTNRIIVDTGFQQGLALSSKKWKQWKAAHPEQPVTMHAGFMPGTGLTVKEEAWAHEISIGSLHLTNVPVIEAYFSQETLGSPGFEAAISLPALRRMELIVDGVHNVAYINPKESKPEPYEHNRLGAVFVPATVQTNDLVAHVAQGSPAEKAGIKAGDVLLKIGTLDTTRWRTDPAVLPLSRFWNQPAGTHLRLTLRRDQRTNEVSVTLENILGPKASTESGAKPEGTAAAKLYSEALALFQDLNDEAALRKGFRLFQQAATAGHADAMNAVGTAQIFGFGTSVAPASEGAALVRKAADAGSTKALGNLSSLILFKIGIQADAKLAYAHLEKAALTGDAEAQYQMGKAYLDPDVRYDPELALQWFQRAAKQSHKSAAAFVGTLNLAQRIKEADPKLGLVLLHQLAAASNGPAQYFLAEHFAGVNPADTNDVDPALALDYCLQAHDLGSRPFPLQLATALAGKVAAEKFGEARTRQAIARLERQQTNHCIASWLLATIYLAEDGKHTNHARAMTLLEAGAKRDCVQSLLTLGDLYATGRGVSISPAKARDYYLAAAAKDKSGEAAMKAASLLFQGAGDNDLSALKQAYRVALDAAKMGNVPACDLLATMLARGGTGELQAMEKAYAWAIIAAENDVADPRTPLSKLEARLNEEQKVEGVKISQFFKVMIRKRAIQEGEKSFRF